MASINEKVDIEDRGRENSNYKISVTTFRATDTGW